ncbi:MAG: chorismate mutase [Spirochaetia bacterium]|nr:chorismate mutase [Spirochaetia bacterium]
MDLDELRKEIDAVDRQIVALFEKRMEISERIAAYKQKVGMQVRDEKREQEKIRQVQNLTHTEFNRQHIEELYTLFISLSRKLQEELTKKS